MNHFDCNSCSEYYLLGEDSDSGIAFKGGKLGSIVISGKHRAIQSSALLKLLIVCVICTTYIIMLYKM